MRRIRTWCLVGTAWIAAGCIPPGYVRDPEPWVAAARWSEAERVTLEMGDTAFRPQVLTLREGRPYVLELANRGRETHRFRAPEFFRAVALQGVRVPGTVDVRAWRLQSVELRPGRSVEIRFVAVRPGTYRAACGTPGHAGRGQAAAIRIVKPEAP